MLVALGRTVGCDPVVQQQVFDAQSVAHAYETLHDEQTEDFNHFLESRGAPRKGKVAPGAIVVVPGEKFTCCTWLGSWRSRLFCG